MRTSEEAVVASGEGHPRAHPAGLRACGASRAVYQRKRREGKGHRQALLALIGRRVNVLWALLRDDTLYETRMPRVTAA
jgi:hypothetical protein